MPPIIIHNGEILDGHHRVAAAIKANLREIPAVEVSDSLVDRYDGAMEPIEMAVERWLEKRWGGTRRNPDDEALLRRLTVEVDDDPASMRGKVDGYVEVRVFDGRSYVAIATFRLKRDYAEAVDVSVNANYRRRGVASWLYRWVENRFGLKVLHSRDQTADGKAFARGRRKNPDDVVASASRSFEGFIYSPEMLEMARDFSGSTSWTQGLCMPLAFGVKKWLGGSARVLGLTTPDGGLQHAVVERDGLIIDGDGIQTREAFLRRWERNLASWPGGCHPLKLGPILAHRRRFSRDFGMTRSNRRDRDAGARGFVDAIARALERRFPFGRARSWFVGGR